MVQPQDRNAPSPATSGAELRLIRMLQSRRLAFGLVGISVLLSSACLLLGFYLDDSIARYIYSDLPGARKLYHIVSGGYGIARGPASDTHFLIEEGWAPWWTYPHLKIILFRPVSLAAHLIDARFWLNSSVLMRLHNLVWLSLLVWATTRMYRRSLGVLVGGMAALLFAVDHTHGFEVGYICNRHVLVAATFGVLCLDQHLRFREQGSPIAAMAAAMFYVLTLLSSEGGMSIGAYLLAYAVFAESGSGWRRALSVTPYVLITIFWRVAYVAGGYGSRGSGLYLDPATEPWRFLREFAERGPILLQGLFLAPPAEFYAVLSPVWAKAMLASSLVVLLALAVAFIPLLARERQARFWAAGALASLIPASSTVPANRQLLFTSIGAMALLAQIWHLHAIELKGTKTSGPLAWSAALGAVFLFVHLIISPAILPITSCSTAVFGQLQRAPSSVGDDIAGRDAVFVTAPEYFAVKLVQLERRVEGQPLPRRWRALSFGAQPVTVRRTGDTTLELTYHGGILNDTFMELYRDRRIPMAVGDRVILKGLTIEVTAITSDKRAERARFTFDTALEAPSFRFYFWRDGRFYPFIPPALGQSVTLPAAQVDYGFW
jgi:hypothetical protein